MPACTENAFILRSKS